MSDKFKEAYLRGAGELELVRSGLDDSMRTAYQHMRELWHSRKDVDDLELFDKEPKGELTVVISERKVNKKTSQKLSESDKSIILKMINKLSVKEITDLINKNSGSSKKEIYNYCLKLKNEI